MWSVPTRGLQGSREVQEGVGVEPVIKRGGEAPCIDSREGRAGEQGREQGREQRGEQRGEGRADNAGSREQVGWFERESKWRNEGQNGEVRAERGEWRAEDTLQQTRGIREESREQRAKSKEKRSRSRGQRGQKRAEIKEGKEIRDQRGQKRERIEPKIRPDQRSFLYTYPKQSEALVLMHQSISSCGLR
jgi:hypothetical protein